MVTDSELNDIIESIIPTWQRAEILFLEPTPRWAPSVQAELTRMMNMNAAEVRTDGGGSTVNCISHTSSRAVFEQIKQGRCDSVVLIVNDQMRDVLLFLGRLTRLCRSSPPVLVVIPPEARSLMPLLLESGATGVICQPVQDTVIAQWCRRVVSASC
jgi:AmiR/NasT family two-component response regulator